MEELKEESKTILNNLEKIVKKAMKKIKTSKEYIKWCKENNYEAN